MLIAEDSNGLGTEPASRPAKDEIPRLRGHAIVATCRCYFFELQPRFASWRSHWERLERIVCDQLSNRAECSMFGTRRCFINSFMQSLFSCLPCTARSIAALACCCLWGLCCLAVVCIYSP